MYLHILLNLVLIGSATLPANSAPARRFLTSAIDSLDQALLFDAPAFQNPSDSSEQIASMQAFVSLGAVDFNAVVSGIASFASDVLKLKLTGGKEIQKDRIQLFGSIGRSGKRVNVKVNGCSKAADLGKTSGLPDLGLVANNVSIGSCSAGSQLIGQVQLESGDQRKFNNTIFPSPPNGFGVISDIDDTIKISHTLDKKALFQSTLIDAPQPVDGMPAVYKALDASLKSPQFMYVSGSPFQLYPFLHDFIASTYPRGPIFLQNLTVVDLPSLLNFANNDGIFEYKSTMIDRIQGMYPQKKFISIGDSTQKDPETYGAAYRRFGGDFIACSWIRKVDGANNTDGRFAAAFQGVPSNKFRLYVDADIPGLANIDVAGGQC